MIKNLKQLDSGVYSDAVKGGHASLSNYLDALASNGEVDASFLPTREERRASSGGRDVTALQHIFATHGIRTRGNRASTGGVFTRGTADYVEGAEVLFPAFVAEAYASAGSDSFYTRDMPFPDVKDINWVDRDQRTPRNRVTLSDIVNARVGIDGDQFKNAIIERGTEDELEPSRVAEAEDLPLYTIKTGEESIRIYKYGGRVRASYEYLRRTKLNLMARTLAGIGRREEIRKLRDALDVAVNGDGNGNPAINVNTGNASAWRLTDFDLLEAEMSDYDREPAMFVADKATLLAIRALRIPTSGVELTPSQLAMYGLGYITPSGVPIKFAPSDSILEGSDKLLTWGIGDGVTQVTENGSIIREADRFIRNQVEEMTISENVGFAKGDPEGFFTLTKAA